MPGFKKSLLVIVALLGLAVVAVAAMLGWTHLAIRRVRPLLPDVGRLDAALAAAPRHPAHVWIINTASQPMPRAAVLDPIHDPNPDAAFVMSFPSFVLEWPDGRLLLIDAGMTRAGAIAFGRPLEIVAGAAPITPHGSITERLGRARDRVGGIVFTHLHADHVGGFLPLCDQRPGKIPVFLPAAQIDESNFTTRGALHQLEQASCSQIRRLDGPAPLILPDFPGVLLLPAGGHTPGSTLVLARVGEGEHLRSLVFAGDEANHMDGVRFDIPKPLAYRLLVVPEDETQLCKVRAFLRAFRALPNHAVLLAHDQYALAEAHIPAWK